MIKTAIITGASKGIGAVIAKRLNELNYNLDSFFSMYKAGSKSFTSAAIFTLKSDVSKD
jgi:short-subunit dehydrogenase involved in D-alanine esterification of teichoic acids